GRRRGVGGAGERGRTRRDRVRRTQLLPERDRSTPRRYARGALGLPATESGPGRPVRCTMAMPEGAGVVPTPPIASPSAVSPTAEPRLVPLPVRLDQPDDPGRAIDASCPTCHRRDPRCSDLSATPSPREA